MSAADWRGLPGRKSALDMLADAGGLPDVRMRPVAGTSIDALSSASAMTSTLAPSMLTSTRQAALVSSSAIPSVAGTIPSAVSKIFSIPPSPFSGVGSGAIDAAEWIELDVDDFEHAEVELGAREAWPSAEAETSVESEAMIGSPHYTVATEAIGHVCEWLMQICPQALSSMEGATRAFNAGGPDYEAQAALSCRRALTFLSDVLCPASEPKPDRHGDMRKLEDHNYANRLLRYLDQARTDDGEYELAVKEMDFLTGLLDHVIDRCQKGVHQQANAREARRVMLQTWNFLSELAQLASR